MCFIFTLSKQYKSNVSSRYSHYGFSSFNYTQSRPITITFRCVGRQDNIVCTNWFHFLPFDFIVLDSPLFVRKNLKHRKINTQIFRNSIIYGQQIFYNKVYVSLTKIQRRSRFNIILSELPCHQFRNKYKTFAIETNVSKNNLFYPHMLYIWHQGKLFCNFHHYDYKFFCVRRHLFALTTYLDTYYLFLYLTRSFSLMTVLNN